MQRGKNCLFMTHQLYTVYQRLCIFGLYGAIQMLLILLLLLLLPISMICVQNGPPNCKNSSPEYSKNRYFETKTRKNFLGRGYPLPTPHHSSAPSVPPLAPLALDHWVPPRFWKSGYGPDAVGHYSTVCINFSFYSWLIEYRIGLTLSK